MVAGEGGGVGKSGVQLLNVAISCISPLKKESERDRKLTKRNGFNRCFCNYYAMFLAFIFVFTIFIYTFAP